MKSFSILLSFKRRCLNLSFNDKPKAGTCVKGKHEWIIIAFLLLTQYTRDKDKSCTAQINEKSFWANGVKEKINFCLNSRRAPSQKGNWLGVATLLRVVPATILDRREPLCGVSQRRENRSTAAAPWARNRRNPGRTGREGAVCRHIPAGNTNTRPWDHFPVHFTTPNGRHCPASYGS